MTYRFNLGEVCIVTAGYPISYNPCNGIFTHRTVKSLAKQLNISVIHLRAMRPDRPLLLSRYWDGIKVFTVSIPQIPLQGFQRLNLYFSLLGFLITRPILIKTDLLHSTGLYPTGFLTSYWAKWVRKPHVSQAIGDDVNIYLPKIMHSKIIKQFTDNTGGISCNSNAIKNKLLEIIPNFSNIQVIQRGVDTNEFSPVGIKKGTQEKLPAVRFGYFGGFQTWNPMEFDSLNTKGGHILLKAWSEVEDRIGQSNLLIAGPGPRTKNLNDWIKRLKRPNAIIDQGRIQPDDIPAYLRSCDVVIIPSINEGLPNIANEAQACGKPVLGSDAGGIPESVINKTTGIIVPKGNAVELTNGILWFYNNQLEIEKMGLKARQHMIDDFNWSSTSSKLISLYRDTYNNRTYAKVI